MRPPDHEMHWLPAGSKTESNREVVGRLAGSSFDHTSMLKRENSSKVQRSKVMSWTPWTALTPLTPAHAEPLPAPMFRLKVQLRKVRL